MDDARTSAGGSAPRAVPLPSVASPRRLLFLVLALGVAGPALPGPSLGPINIFPYRLLLPVLLVVFAWRSFDRQGRLDVSSIRVRVQFQFLGFWLIYAFATLFWARSTADAVEDLVFLFLSLSLITVTVFTLRSLADLDRFYRFWLLVLVAINVIGVWEVLTGQHLPMSKSNEVYFDHDLPTCVFRNPNDFATVLTLGLPFMLTLISDGRGLLRRLLGAGVVLSTLGLILATGSRANVVAVLLGAAFWFLFLLPPRRKAATLAMAVVLAALLAAFAGDAFRSRVAEIGEELESLNLERMETTGTSLNIRRNLISNAALLAVDTYGFGVGAGNVEYRLKQDPSIETQGIVNVHNWWIEILANYGLGIFVGYVAFYLSLVAGLWRGRRLLSDPRERRICDSLLFGLVAFSVASTSSSSVMTLRPHWLFIAFALAFLNYVRNVAGGTRP